VNGKEREKNEQKGNAKGIKTQIIFRDSNKV
jgi:hypothetical protein